MSVGVFRHDMGFTGEVTAIRASDLFVFLPELVIGRPQFLQLFLVFVFCTLALRRHLLPEPSNTGTNTVKPLLSGPLLTTSLCFCGLTLRRHLLAESSQHTDINTVKPLLSSPPINHPSVSLHSHSETPCVGRTFTTRRQL